MKHFILLLILSFSFSQTNFNLEDLNENSAYFGQTVGPEEFSNQVSIVYFGYFYWGICTSRFGELNDFYQELISAGHNDKVKLFGVGKDSHINQLSNWTNQNESIVSADSSPFSVWNSWDASQRDLYILDSDGNIQYHQDISSGISNSVYDLVYNLIDEIEVSIQGDVNSDGLINIVDVVQTVNMVLGTVEINPLADMNNDSMINVIDIVNIVNIILGTE